MRILSGVFEDERTGGPVTTGTPISLMIENVDQRSKDYSEIAHAFRPGHADYAYLSQVRRARLSRRRAVVGAGDRGPRRRRRGGAQGAGRRRHHPRRPGADRAASRSTAPAGTGTRSRNNPFWSPGPGHGRGLGSAPGERAQGRLVHRRGDRGRGRRRAGRLGRADLRQARRRTRRGPDVDQRRQGGGDRRRLRRRARSPARRTPTRCGWATTAPLFLSNHAGGVLGGISTGQPIVARVAFKPTSSILTPAPLDRRGGRGDRAAHQGPPRPLRRHPRRAGGRGHGRLRPRRRHAAPPGPDRSFRAVVDRWR